MKQKHNIMKAIIEKYDNLKSLVETVKEINEANAGNYSVFFDENFVEVAEDEVENGEEYAYSDRDESEIRKMQEKAWNDLIDELKKIGFDVSTPYDSSIYITKNGKDAISIRDHEVKNSTLNHWDSVYGVNILTDTLSEKILNLI